MIDAAEADVVGPAIAADGPHGLLGQVLLVIQDVLSILAFPGGLQSRDQRVGHATGLLFVRPVSHIVVNGLHSHTGCLQALHADEQLLADGILSVEEAEGELGIVLKQGMLPGRTKAAVILAVGQDGGTAAVSGRTAGSVANVHPLTHQLADQLDIGGLGTAGAGGGELEIGLGKLDGLHVLAVDDILLQVALVHGHLIEADLLLFHFLEGGHGEGILHRASLQAYTAT